ncbi:MAG: DNA polymerase III subunit delta' [Desulfobacterales bacterium]|nr:DNA polymerase III subunit delta' [Desulfobacterales bacterium]
MANAIDSIIGQEKALGMLTGFLGNATIPHALVFSGLKGSGKMAAATAFAMACNCTGSRAGSQADADPGAAIHTALFACGHCPACHKIKSANHPDLLHLKPSGDIIKVKQIRELLDTLALKPFEASTRVVILQEANSLNPSAGNALLKALEEPPGDTIFILTTGELSGLMPTIISRCQHVRFRPVDRALITRALIDDLGISPSEAALAAHLSGGSLKRAQRILDSDWMHYRQWLLKETVALTVTSPGTILALAAVLASRKERIVDAISILKSWFRDLLVCKHAPERLINQDMQDLVQTAARKETSESLLKKLKAIDTVSRRFAGNANVRLCLESLLLKLARI